MRCRHCGAEIADRAIVCYRCGIGTTEPVRKAAEVRRRRSPLLSLLAAAMLLLSALYLGYAAPASANPGQWRSAAAVLAGAALVVVLLRLIRRRR